MARPVSSGTPAGVPDSWERRFPDETIVVEQNKLNGAAIILVFGALAAGLIVFVAGGAADPRWIPRGTVWPEGDNAAALAVLPMAAAAVLCGVWMARARSMVAAVLCLALTLAQGVLLGLFLSWVGAVIQAGVTLSVLSALLALRRLRDKLSGEAERNPLVAQFRDLVGLLARVAVVDGHIDPREVSTIRRLCDSSRIAPATRDAFIDEALDAAKVGAADVETLAAAYLDRAQSAGFPHPGRTALMAALSVAAADGIIGEREEAELRALGRALALDEQLVAAEIAAHRAQLTELTPELARALLDLAEGWNLEELEEAHRALREDLHAGDFEHLGAGLTEYARRRIELLDLAYETLRETA